MQNKTAETTIHESRADGHRSGNQKTLAALINGNTTQGPIITRHLRNLLSTGHVLFSTLDDDYLGFILVALLRSMLKKPTTGLFFRTEQCFRNDRKIIYPAKRLAFRWLKKLPHLRLIAIVPYSIRPEYAEITHDWIYDPQLWDLWLKGKPKPKTTLVSAAVKQIRADRKILLYIGTLTKRKGIDSLIKHVKENFESTLLVCAGNVDPNCTGDANTLRSMGAVILDRWVSDDEIESLYEASDQVWCKYDPSYDQASGVLGRAIQLSKPPITRDGSIAAALMTLCDSQRKKADLHEHCKSDEEFFKGLIADAKTKLSPQKKL